jgi:phenylalanyl-tRNA synthetase alpha chain
MLDLSLLTDKQRQFIYHLLATPEIASLRAHCDRHEFDFNFAKGFLLSDVLKDSVELRELGQPVVELTAKGNALNGILPGTLLVKELRQNITDLDQLQTTLGEAFGLHYNALRKEQAVNLVTQGEAKTLEILDRSILDTFEQRQQLFTDLSASGSHLPTTPSSELTWLIQQDLIVQRGATDYAVSLLKSGEAIANLSLTPALTPSVTTLTSALLLSGDWQAASFKPYNIHDEVPDIAYGRPSILTQCIQRIRTIFLEMGFDEMAGCMVESTFWNFDALFTPQDHPAREIQDTSNRFMSNTTVRHGQKPKPVAPFCAPTRQLLQPASSINFGDLSKVICHYKVANTFPLTKCSAMKPSIAPTLPSSIKLKAL